MSQSSSSPWRTLTTAAVATGGALAALAGANAWIRSATGPLPDQLRGARQTFPWREHEVVYYTAGPADGPPLLLLHGHNAAASAWEMREPFRRLGERYRVFAPDLLGYGCSDRPPLPYTAELYIDLLRDFLREAVREPAAVIASSVSAAHAIRVAADDPEWITRLVVIQPTGLARQTGPAPGGAAIAALFRSPVLGEALFNGLASRASIRYFLQSQSYVNSDCVDADLVELNYQTAHQPGARYAPAAFVGGLLFHDVSDAWPRVGQPVLVAWGQEAHFSPLRDSAAFLALNPGAQLEAFSPAGILPHDEQPEEFATVVGAWLERNA